MIDHRLGKELMAWEVLSPYGFTDGSESFFGIVVNAGAEHILFHNLSLVLHC